jgi:uncharacterized protein
MPFRITTLGVAFTQNFDTLANSGSSLALPTDWIISESGTAANSTYTAGTGSSTTGDSYSFGATGSTERALGTLQSGSLVSTIGTSYTNNTGSTITSLLLSYFGEQWRLGTAGRVDRLDFQISFDATSLTTGTWTNVDALDFTAPVTSGATGALDGNSPANRTAISSTITSLTIADGTTFWIRWVDLNATGSDDGLAIDDFSLTAQSSAGSSGALAIAAASVAEGNIGTTDISFTVTRSGGSTGAVAATWTATLGSGVGNADAGDFAVGQLFTGTVNFADGETSQIVTLSVAGDEAVEPNEAFTVTLSVPLAGHRLPPLPQPARSAMMIRHPSLR